MRTTVAATRENAARRAAPEVAGHATQVAAGRCRRNRQADTQPGNPPDTDGAGNVHFDFGSGDSLLVENTVKSAIGAADLLL